MNLVMGSNTKNGQIVSKNCLQLLIWFKKEELFYESMSYMYVSLTWQWKKQVPPPQPRDLHPCKVVGFEQVCTPLGLTNSLD